MKKVSVIVPVYNVEIYLERCLKSLINQSYTNYEIICINDCSPDHSQDILDKYALEYPNKVKVLVNEKNRGLGLTRDRAVREAEGEYLLFVDSDDYVDESYIETYLRYAIKDDLDVVVGGYIKDTEGKMKSFRSPEGIWSIVSYTIACAKMYKKEFVINNHLEFLNYKCGEDIYFNLNVFLSNPKYCVMDYAGYYYFTNINSITGTMNSEKNLEVMVDEMFARLMGTHCQRSEYENQILSYVYITHIINTMINYNRGCGIKRMKEKYQFCFDHLEEKFPNYRDNPYIGIFKPKGQSLKIRFAVTFVMTLKKYGLDKMFFEALAVCPF